MSDKAKVVATFTGRNNVYSAVAYMETDLPADALGEVCAEALHKAWTAGEDPCGCALTLAFFPEEPDTRPLEDKIIAITGSAPERALDTAGKPVSAEMQAALDKAHAEAKTAPAAPYGRYTPEQKAFGDKRIAENIRYKYTSKLSAYTDTQVADGFERWRDDEANDANLNDEASRKEFSDLLWDIYGESEPGEHAEVIAALNSDGEDHG